MIFAIMEFSRAMYSYEFISYAAQEGARYAIVRGYETSESNCPASSPTSFTISFSCIAQQADVQNYVKSLALPLINRNNLTVTYNTSLGVTPDGATAPCSNPNSGNSKGCLIKVTVNYSFGFIAPFMPKNASSFSGASEKVIQQ
jgi:Flp pilus assembly protein TadG